MARLFDLRAGDFRDVVFGDTLDVASDADLLAAPPELSSAMAVRLHMPSFKDGRAFSQAVLLRRRYGFEGELIVSGHVLPDQALALLRVGVTLVELADERRAEDFVRSLSAYRHAYQRPAAGRPVFELRGAAK